MVMAPWWQTSVVAISCDMTTPPKDSKANVAGQLEAS